MEALKSFGIEPILLLAQIVNFLLVVFLLQKFFYKPIVKMLNERRSKIEESLKNADEIEQKLQKTDEQTKAIMDQARQNAELLLADAKKESRRIVDSAIEDGRRIKEDAQIQGKQQIEAERARMQSELQAETMLIVGQVIKKVLGRSMSAGEKEQMTKQSVSQITKHVS